MKKIDIEKETKVIQLYESGLSCKSIEKAIGINSTTVFNILKRNNIKTRTKGGIQELPISKLIEEYKDGNSIIKIAQDYNVTEHTITNYLEKANIPRNNIYHNKSLNRDYFEIIDSYDKAYFLGLFLTDGNVGSKTNNISITLSEKDSAILEVLRNKTRNENQLKVLSRKNRQNKEITYHLKSAKMKSDLAEYGIVPNKTYTVSPPNIPEHLMSHFIRGLIDGDGWISYKSKQIGFCGNEIMVTFVRDYLSNMLDIYRVKVLQTQPHLFQIAWAGKNNAIRIGNYLYDDKHECYITRKYSNYLKLIS